MPEWHKLTELANKHGTDRGTTRSWAHGYTETYGPMLEHLKDEPVRILEIGIKRGYGMMMLRDYFTEAEIIGIDIAREPRLPVMKGVTALSMDATDKEAVATLPPFDIVFDDASHMLEDQIATFEVLFPRMREGGYYFIEDCNHDPNSSPYWGQQPGVTMLHGGKLALFRKTSDGIQ
jgi:cephalosporin hydroxylase